MPEPAPLDRLAAALVAGETSAADLAAGFLDRAGSGGATFIAIDAQQVRREAEASDARRRAGRALGPLDGVPVAVKDNIDVAGYATTNGSLCDGAEAMQADAPVIAALRGAGMVVAGKTNLSEFAFSGLGLNPHFGTPLLRRHTPPRVPGGSSAGSAVAVAEGLVPLALGTDTAGSLRVPPAFTGTVGLRASRGRYAMRGVRPLAQSFDALGAIAAHPGDLRWFDALARGLGAPAPVGDEQVDILVDRAFTDQCGMTEEVARGFALFTERLAGAGAAPQEARLSALAETAALLTAEGWPGGAEAAAEHAVVLAGPGRERIDRRVVTRLEAGARMGTDRLDHIMSRRAPLQRLLAGELGGRIAIMPTVRHVPPLLSAVAEDADAFARINLDTLALTMIGSFLDTPAVALPAGETPEGLTVSVTLFGAPGQDAARRAPA